MYAVDDGKELFLYKNRNNKPIGWYCHVLEFEDKGYELIVVNEHHEYHIPSSEYDKYEIGDCDCSACNHPWSGHQLGKEKIL